MDANIADVRKKLLLMIMEPNQKIIDYVNMARSYNDDLTAMGEPETERAMIGHIVNGLPEDWSDAGRSVGACYQCGKTGHKAFECAENPRSRNYKGNGAGWSGAQQNGVGNGRGPKGKFNGACHHCKKIGHRAIECYSNPNSWSYRGLQQQGSAPSKANAVATPTAAENGKEDAILGGAHKANVAHASEVCMLAKGGGAAAWFMDSGCTQHMTNHCEWLTGMRESSVPYVILGNEGKLPVKGEGELVLQGQYGELKLENVPYVDGLALNLISQSQLESTGCKTFSDKGKMWVFDHAWNVIAEGMRNDGLYEMKLNEKVLAAEKATYQPPPKEGVMARKELKAKLKGVPVEELQVEAVAMVAAAAKVDLETLHRHLGHAGMERIKELVKKSMAAGVELKEGDGSKGRCGKC
ncbi:unnamed protein product, partial [Closterium sp. NIES-54]